MALTIAEDALVVDQGTPDARDDTVKLIASDLTLPDPTPTAPRGPVVVAMAAGALHPADGRPARDVLGAHPGTTEVHLQLVNGERSHVLRLGDGSGSRRPRR